MNPRDQQDAIARSAEILKERLAAARAGRKRLRELEDKQKEQVYTDAARVLAEHRGSTA